MSSFGKGSSWQRTGPTPGGAQRFSSSSGVGSGGSGSSFSSSFGGSRSQSSLSQSSDDEYEDASDVLQLQGLPERREWDRAPQQTASRSRSQMRSALASRPFRSSNSSRISATSYYPSRTSQSLSPPRRRNISSQTGVTFSTAPPQVFHYPPEYSEEPPRRAPTRTSAPSYSGRTSQSLSPPRRSNISTQTGVTFSSAPPQVFHYPPEYSEEPRRAPTQVFHFPPQQPREPQTRRRRRYSRGVNPRVSRPPLQRVPFSDQPYEITDAATGRHRMLTPWANQIRQKRTQSLPITMLTSSTSSQASLGRGRRSDESLW